MIGFGDARAPPAVLHIPHEAHALEDGDDDDGGDEEELGALEARLGERPAGRTKKGGKGEKDLSSAGARKRAEAAGKEALELTMLPPQCTSSSS